MRIISWNVNGIRAADKKGFLEWLKKDSPDILCIQETKASPNQIAFNLRHPPDYKSYWSTAEKKGYSGVAVYSREQPLKVEHKLGMPAFDYDGRILVMEYKSFILLNLYFPHGGRDKENLPYKLEAYKAFLEYLGNIKPESKPVILCGDFNIAHKDIDLARPKDNRNNIMFTKEERENIDRIISVGFTDTFRHFHKAAGCYTWWPYLNNARERNIGWRIDYIFISNTLVDKAKDAFTLPNVKGSDHCPTGMEINLQ